MAFSLITTFKPMQNYTLSLTDSCTKHGYSLSICFNLAITSLSRNSEFRTAGFSMAGRDCLLMVLYVRGPSILSQGSHLTECTYSPRLLARTSVISVNAKDSQIQAQTNVCGFAPLLHLSKTTNDKACIRAFKANSKKALSRWKISNNAFPCPSTP